MAIDIRYDKEKRIVYATIEEQFSQSDFIEALNKITQSEEHKPDISVLWDARTINMKSIEKGFERKFLSDLVQIRTGYPNRGTSRIAIIVTGDYLFGMGRMYEILSGDLPQNIMIFRDYIQGENWLLSQ